MWGTVIIGITNVLATFIAIAFVDKLGRKPIMYAGFVTMGVAMIAVGTLFNLGVEKHPELGYFAIAALLDLYYWFCDERRADHLGDLLGNLPT